MLKLSPKNILKSEYLKFWTLKSNSVLLGVTFLTIILFGIMASYAAAGGIKPPAGGPPIAGRNPLETVLSGANLGVLLLGVLGVLAGAREYSSAMITTTLAVVPSRLPVLWSKIWVFFSITLPVILVGVVTAFFVGTTILNNAKVPSAAWADPGVSRSVVGMAVSLVGFGIIGLALGMLMRSIAGGLATLIGGVLIVPTLAAAILPSSWGEVLKFLPSQASAAFSGTTTMSATLSPGWGEIVFGLWIVVAIFAAALVLKIRDV